jgi:5'-3' exonuclease
MADLEVPPIHDVDATCAWENALLREVRRVVKEVWAEAGRPSQVYIAVDGVVPMAKIRQQRVRRFKSAYLRKIGGWDTNSITPGTSFMAKLNKELESLVKEQSRGRSWILSGSDEPGEGEHKIMNWLRSTEGKREGAVCIYGLDADLILLSMLTGEMIEHKNLWLLRERQEFGGVDKDKQKGADDPQRYTFLNIEELKLRIGVRGVDEVLNYVGVMSLMGNDFLPHSLTHKLNDDGHDAVLDVMRGMKRTKKWLVSSEGLLQRDVLLEICRAWSGDEEGRMLRMVRKKREQAGRGVSRGMDETEGLPLKWDVEKVLVGQDSRLVGGWRKEYWKWIHPFADRGEVCGDYVFGLQWILDYYTGLRPCSKFWLFSSWLPPLWSDLVRFLEGGSDSGAEAQRQVHDQDPIQPEEQLAMVLPLDSWGLIRGRNLRQLPALQPQLWPLKYTFFSAGRKWLWECEARIPILTAERLRDILKSGH